MSGTVFFGVAGNPDAFYRAGFKASADVPAWLRSLGLDAYEYQCGRGVRISRAAAETIGARAAEANIRLSLHAPYFINPANPEPEALQRNIDNVLAACTAAQQMGARRIVIHTGALMKRSRAEALEITKRSFREILRACDVAGFGNLTLCPETMGKVNQLGDLDEVLELCALDERLLPCVDFGHLYARTFGVLEGADACRELLDKLENRLGRDRARVFHSHFSHVEFTLRGGEKRHLRFADGGYGPDFAPLAEELARRGWSPTIICESAGTQSADALTMQALWRAAEAGRPGQ